MTRTRSLAAMAAVFAASFALGEVSAPQGSPVGEAAVQRTVRSSPPVTVPFVGAINRQAVASCLAGEKVISGGVAVTGIPGGTREGEYNTFVVRDTPLPEPPTGRTPTGWLVEVTNHSASLGAPGGEDAIVQAHVICQRTT